MVFAAGSTFDPVYNFFGAILAFFYSIIPNLGVSIILLTVARDAGRCSRSPPSRPSR